MNKMSSKLPVAIYVKGRVTWNGNVWLIGARATLETPEPTYIESTVVLQIVEEIKYFLYCMKPYKWAVRFESQVLLTCSGISRRSTVYNLL